MSEKIECENCQGDGYTAEHSPNCQVTDYHEATCPIQVQCETCNGSGEAEEKKCN